MKKCFGFCRLTCLYPSETRISCCQISNDSQPSSYSEDVKLVFWDKRSNCDIVLEISEVLVSQCDAGYVSRKGTRQDQTVMAVDASTRHCVFHKQIPKGDKAFDVQWGGEGHMEPSPPSLTSTSSLTLTNTHTHTSPQKQLTF